LSQYGFCSKYQLPSFANFSKVPNLGEASQLFKSGQDKFAHLGQLISVFSKSL